MPVRALRTDTTSSKRAAKQYQYSPYVPPPSAAQPHQSQAAPRHPNGSSFAGRTGGGAGSNSKQSNSQAAAANSRALTLLLTLGGTLYLLLQLIALRQSDFRATVAEHSFIASHRHSHHHGRKVADHSLQVEDGKGGVDVILDGGVSNIDVSNLDHGHAAGHEGRGELRVRLPNGRGEMLRPAPKLALKVGDRAWEEDRRDAHRKRGQDEEANGNNNGEGMRLRGAEDAKAASAAAAAAAVSDLEQPNDGWEPELPPPDEAFMPDEAIPGDTLLQMDADAAIERAKQSQRDADRLKAKNKQGEGANNNNNNKERGDGRKKKQAEAMDKFQAHEIDAGVNRPDTLSELVHKMMPDNLEYASDVSTKPDPDKPDVPIYWNIPASGTDLITTIVQDCLHLGTVSDLTRAKEGWGLQPDDGVVITPEIWNAIDYLDGIHHGRLFGMFVHPVQRAVDMLSTQKVEDPGGIGRLGTLEEYARSKYHEANWMVRHLAGVPRGEEPTVNDLAVSREVLRTKFVVGLLPYKDASIKRFERYFGWIFPKGGVDCRQKAIADAGAAEKSTVEKGSPGWVAISKANELDIKLFEYVNHLFFAQKDLFH